MMFMRFAIDAVFVGKPETSGSGGDPAGSMAAPGDVRPVVSVHRGLRAWTGLVPLVRGAHGVLELPVGTIDATGTEIGDRDTPHRLRRGELPAGLGKSAPGSQRCPREDAPRSPGLGGFGAFPSTDLRPSVPTNPVQVGGPIRLARAAR